MASAHSNHHNHQTWGLTRTTDAADEPVTTAEAKSHLRVDISDDDTLIDTLIATARQYIEIESKRSLQTQTWKLNLDEFPRHHHGDHHHSHSHGSHDIWLDNPPLIDVTSVKYFNTAGVQTTLVESTDYQVDTAAEPGRIAPEPGTFWPAVETNRLNAVEIIYRGGYGVASTTVPPFFIHAILLLVGHWYENREDVIVGTISTTLPNSVKRLIALGNVPVAI